MTTFHPIVLLLSFPFLLAFQSSTAEVIAYGARPGRTSKASFFEAAFSPPFATTNEHKCLRTRKRRRTLGPMRACGHDTDDNDDVRCRGGVPFQKHRLAPPSSSTRGTPTRREAFNNIISGLFATPVLASTMMMLIPVEEANAACLGGDLREECIGVYKLPLDDGSLKYVDTQEKLMKYAPDLKWVPPIEYPKTYGDAVTQLQEQRVQCDAVRGCIAKGSLTEGGIALLDIIPKVGAAGKVVVLKLEAALNDERNRAMQTMLQAGAAAATRSEDGQEEYSPLPPPPRSELGMKAYRVEYAHEELMGYLGECDILIGQGLRGDLGALTPAQIQILSTLGDVAKEFDELLRAVPEKV